MLEFLEELNPNLLPKILINVTKNEKIDLKNDIVNYYYIKNLFFGEYAMLFGTDFFVEDYIVYDILSYLNDDNINYLFSKYFINFWKRKYNLKNKDDIFIINYLKNDFFFYKSGSKFNILLGLMTPAERIHCFFTCMLRYFG